MLWSTAGFEAETLDVLIKDTAIFHVNRCKFLPERYLMLSTPIGEIYVGDGELKAFNELVEKEIENLEDNDTHSEIRKWNDYRSDCADNNWKEREMNHAT